MIAFLNNNLNFIPIKTFRNSIGMLKKINFLVHLGITSDLPFDRQNKIRIFNASCFFISIIAVFNTFLFGFYQYYNAAYLTIFEFFALLFGLFLVHKKQSNAAFHFVYISSFLFLFASAMVLGEKSEIHVYLLFMPLAAIALFDSLKIIITYFILAMSVLIALMILFQIFKPQYPANMIIEGIGLSSMVFTGFLIFLIMKQFKTENVAFNNEINFQRLELEEKNKDIRDSMHYAKKIQRALMASDTLLKKNLNEFFLLYKPKDIVSGDFYWAEQVNSHFLVAVCDCTGHGVPGAFMSLLNITKLNETINEKKIIQPDLVLNQVREDIIKALNPEGTEEERKDGMDAVFCRFDFKNLKMDFACANNPIWIIRDEQGKSSIMEFKADKMPVGMHFGEKNNFNLNSIDLKKGDTIYLFTDGYADQFGGSKGKKFKYSQLKEVLLSIHKFPMQQQQEILNEKIEKWKGSLDQVDDILLMGIKI